MQETIEHIFSIFNGGKELFGIPLTSREKGILKNLKEVPEQKEIGLLAYSIKEKFGVSEHIAACAAFCIALKKIEVTSILTRRLSKSDREWVSVIKTEYSRKRVKGIL